MRVLVIEDETETRVAIEKKLSEEGFNVYSTELGEEGIGLGRFYNYDIIILDLKLPDVHGYDVLRRLREAKINTPILILSSVLGANSKSKALWGGADDYMTKPFDFKELVSRIHAIIRRSHGFAESVVKTGRLSINLLTKVVEVDGQPLHMTKKEYLIMELLSLCKGTLVTKEMFLNHLYGGLYEPNQKIIDVVICKLRKKIANVTGGQNIIFTDWGRGYILRDSAEAKILSGASAEV